jgi:hypothetical protein
MKAIASAALTIFSLVLAGLNALAGPNVYLGNLHSHTSYSDGSGTPAEAYRYARDVGHLDFLAITEHNHSKAENGIPKGQKRRDGILIATDHALYNGTQQNSLISAAKRANVDNSFVAIYGQEFSTINSGNHVNVFEIGDVIDENDVPNGEFKRLVNWLETKPDSQHLPAILQFNHSSKTLRNRSIEYGADDFDSPAEWQDRMSKHVRLIEVLNGPGTKDGIGQTPTLFERDYLDYLNEGFKVGPTGDQDNHWKNWGPATEARTGVIADALTKPKILDALRSRHVYATSDKNLKVLFFVNGHLCGDIISPPAAGSELNIQYSIVDEDEPDADYEIQVYSDTPGNALAEEIEKVTDHGNSSPDHLKSIEGVRFANEHQYLFFKITQTNEDEDSDRAWTAPVWFEASGPVSPSGPSTPAGDFVASRTSSIYHAASCPIAKGIKSQNRVTGSDAMRGRSPHESCLPR